MLSWGLLMRFAVACAFLSLGAGVHPGLHAQDTTFIQLPFELRGYITRFTGPQPSACGYFQLKGGLRSPSQPAIGVSTEDLEEAVSCGATAATEGKPFFAVSVEPGIDSVVFDGLLGTAEGIVFKFLYSSSTCGGPACAGALTISRCDLPNVVTTRAGRASIGCRVY
jgi:hypothetical protein